MYHQLIFFTQDEIELSGNMPDGFVPKEGQPDDKPIIRSAGSLRLRTETVPVADRTESISDGSMRLEKRSKESGVKQEIFVHSS